MMGFLRLMVLGYQNKKKYQSNLEMKNLVNVTLMDSS